MADFQPTDKPTNTADPTDEDIAKDARAKQLAYLRTQGPRTQAKVDDWLDQHVNQPMAAKGWPKTGAAISAVGSASSDLAMPANSEEAGVFIPGKGALSKAASAAEEEAGPLVERVINYGRQPKRTITEATTGWGSRVAAPKHMPDEDIVAEAQKRGLIPGAKK